MQIKPLIQSIHHGPDDASVRGLKRGTILTPPSPPNAPDQLWAWEQALHVCCDVIFLPSLWQQKLRKAPQCPATYSASPPQPTSQHHHFTFAANAPVRAGPPCSRPHSALPPMWHHGCNPHPATNVKLPGTLTAPTRFFLLSERPPLLAWPAVGALKQHQTQPKAQSSERTHSTGLPTPQHLCLRLSRSAGGPACISVPPRRTDLTTEAHPHCTAGVPAAPLRCASNQVMETAAMTASKSLCSPIPSLAYDMRCILSRFWQDCKISNVT